ncbi:hypothetical protein FACS1894137_05240 [Spirochaetia bacterium]|nr:hypothetical protein FACS1894137_05240 [Spirochaetia bacterium]
MVNKEEAAGIFRQLSPENQATLLPFFHLALIAENSARKAFAHDMPAGDGGPGPEYDFAHELIEDTG